MWLTAGSRYALDGVEHQIPLDEKVIGLPPVWNAGRVAFFTKLKELLLYFHTTCEREHPLLHLLWNFTRSYQDERVSSRRHRC